MPLSVKYKRFGSYTSFPCPPLTTCKSTLSFLAFARLDCWSQALNHPSLRMSHFLSLNSSMENVNILCLAEAHQSKYNSQTKPHLCGWHQDSSWLPELLDPMGTAAWAPALEQCLGEGKSGCSVLVLELNFELITYVTDCLPASREVYIVIPNLWIRK